LNYLKLSHHPPLPAGFAPFQACLRPGHDKFMVEKRERGRPPKPDEERRDSELRIRLTEGEREALDSAAQGNTSTWARDVRKREEKSAAAKEARQLRTICGVGLWDSSHDPDFREPGPNLDAIGLFSPYFKLRHYPPLPARIILKSQLSINAPLTGLSLLTVRGWGEVEGCGETSGHRVVAWLGIILRLFRN
jgi:hypothetical protein